ncbi:transposase, partial [Candidatus Bipolaricaulota bacterium]|nr:transposase [Candidatus Bipolaricaulota bacterium]
TRDLLTLFGPLEDLRVPRVREGDFRPKLLPYRRRTSIELSEAILALYASRASTRDISRDSVRGVPLPKRASPLTQVVEEEVREWQNRPLAREYYAIYLDGSFLSVRRGKAAKEPVYLALGIRSDGRREIFSSSKWQLCVLHTVRKEDGRPWLKLSRPSGERTQLSRPTGP